MREKIYFHLLILCGIWSHGIIGTFANEEIKESSDFLVRHRRVISEIPNEDTRVNIINVNYVVVIKYFSRIRCVGNIISNYIVITATSCAESSPEDYHILSDTSTAFRGKYHNVIDIRRHLAIALFTTGQPFVFGAFCRNIQLHVGPLLPGEVGQVSGWGFNWRGTVRGTEYPEHLRSIQVPIIAHQDCVNRYRPHITITDKEVCTYHPQRHSGHNDFGAGLVIDGYLAGVFLWSGLNQNSTNHHYPDVFAVLQDFDYNHWIRSNIQDINTHMMRH